MRKSKSNSGPPKSNGSNGKKRINLALQGGGAHGAFTWGVLDELLADGRIEIEGMSGTSAGAVNAVMVADGLARGGPEEARKRLADFWRAASRDGDMSKLNRAISDRLFSLIPIAVTPFQPFFDAMSRTLSPYDLNPLNINPLRDLIVRFVDFDAVKKSGMPLFIAATNVHTGRLRVFPREKIDADAVMASAALPYVFRAVEIDGVPYWDGGYTANPPIYPFFRTTETEDVLVVQINPVVRAATPHSAQEIMNRVNEITFNSSLVAEYPRHRVRAAADRRRRIETRDRAGRIPPHQRAPHRSGFHRPEADAVQQAQHRLRFLRDAAPRRPPGGPAVSRPAFRRYRRAQHHRPARGDARREGRGDARGPRPADEVTLRRHSGARAKRANPESEPGIRM